MKHFRILIGLLWVSSAALLFAKTETAVLAAGCFWCTEVQYERVPGVLSVVSGYTGGTSENPTYQEIGTGQSGHVEAILIEFDPEKVSYERLVDLFWKTHDATDGRGVAPDFGPQYRSMIFYQSEAQKVVAEKSRDRAQANLPKKIATEIRSLNKFTPAEDYHQDYAKKNPNDPYVRGVSGPKLKKFEKVLSELKP
jgi:peptide-methionine (S)-S-oxide reductase